MVNFSYDDITAAAEYPAAVLLSDTSRALIVAALQLMDDQYRWLGGYDPATWDTIQAAVSEANREVMTNMLLGSVIWVAGSAPDGTLVCDGSTFGRVDYPALYAVLDAVYIIDADTFQVPDLRGVFPIGAGGSLAVGDTGGEAAHTLTTTEMPSHAHTDAGHTHTEIIATATLINGGLEAPAASAIPAASVTGVGYASIQNTGGDSSHNNLPPYEALLPCLIAR